jgi:hypothetical protein
MSWRGVLYGPFALANCFTGTLLAFLVPWGFFAWVQLPTATALSVALLSPWLSAILAPLILPITWPEAVARGWVGVLPAGYYGRASWPLVFLRTHGTPRQAPDAMRYALVRHLCIGCYAALAATPIGVALLLRRPPRAEAAAYIAAVTAGVLPLSLLAFGLAPNHARVVEAMRVPADAPLWRRFLVRALRAPLA